MLVVVGLVVLVIDVSGTGSGLVGTGTELVEESLGEEFVGSVVVSVREALILAVGAISVRSGE